MSLEDAFYPLLRIYETAPAPVRSLAGRAFRALPATWRHGSSYSRFQAEAAAVADWDAEEIRRYQIAALRDALMAAARAPFYQQRFAERGLQPHNFESLSQLRDYPLLTKQDLLHHREQMVNQDLPAWARLYLTTGGSSGVPVGFYLQRGVSRPKEQAYLEAQWARRGYRPGDRVAVIRGGVTSSHAHGTISRHDASRDWLILSSYHLTPARLPEYVKALNQFRPRHLHAYPSAALLLARAMTQANLRFDFRLVSVLCGSEKLTQEAQTELEQAFAAPVFHWYGHSERVVLAGQGSRSDHLYFWPTYGFVEFGPVNAEGHCEIIGTSFHNRLMPLIRYRTGDYVKLPQAPHAELPGMPEVEAVMGRDYEFLISATGRRISLTAINMHDRIFDGLLAVQFHQEREGAVEFRYQPGSTWHSSREDSIRTGLLQKLGNDFQLTLRAVRETEKTKAGKHRWLVSEIGGAI
jgi:phenylacetate-CoA ligase